MQNLDVHTIPTIWVIPVILAFFVVRRWIAPGVKLPPGPRKLPFVGNMFSMPTDQAWHVYADWCQHYGSDVIHLTAAGTDMIILGSLKACHDLLDMRSSLYSSRPRLPMLVELMDWSFNWGLLPYGESWQMRAHRRISNQTFNENAVKKYRPQQLQSARSFLQDLLVNPDAFRGHIRLMLGRTIMSVMYGIDVQSGDDAYIVHAETAMSSLLKVGIARYLVDLIPWLKYVPSWLPGAQFKRDAKVWCEDARRMVDLPMAETMAQIAAGTARNSFVSEHLGSFLGSSTEFALHEEVKNVAGTAYAAAADTTGSLLATFFLAMTMHPDVQKKAVEELDRVLGPGALPTFDDEVSLPYIGAICKDLSRWRPVAPMGIPHVVDGNDIYKGYHIPKGSLVMPNVWAILHDKTMYGSDADSFNPERFLLEGELNPVIPDPTVMFGFGRRICPGRHMANASIFITIASVLSCFTVSKAMDENGVAIEPNGNYTGSVLIAPDPFQCTIKPRSKDMAELVRAHAEVELA